MRSIAGIKLALDQRRKLVERSRARRLLAEARLRETAKIIRR